MFERDEFPMTMRLVPEFLLFCLALRHPQLPKDTRSAGGRDHSRPGLGIASLPARAATASPRTFSPDLQACGTASNSRPRHRAIGIDQKIDVAGAAQKQRGEGGGSADSVTPLSASARIPVPSKGAHEPTNLLNLGKVAHRRGDGLLVWCRPMTGHGEQPTGLREPIHPAQSPGQFAAYRQAIEEVG